jgi:plasmid stabilization system protein ParE
MIVVMLAQAEEDLERAFDYYQSQRAGLGLELLEDFRRGIDRILEFPAGCSRMDQTYRRYRVYRFPYGIVYRESESTNEIVVAALMHMSRKPGYWK